MEFVKEIGEREGKLRGKEGLRWCLGLAVAEDYGGKRL
tara:strand:- start:795 stop:908 length:114 start_codon:yes stop_codon:yes gene_type:complete